MALLTLPRVIVRKTTSNAHKLGCQSRFYLSWVLIIFMMATSIPDACGKGMVKEKCSKDGKTCYSVIRLNTTENITREMMNTSELLFNKYTDSNKTTIDEEGLSQLLKDLGMIETKLPDNHAHEEHHNHDEIEVEDHGDHESFEENDHLSETLLGESDHHVEEDHGNDHSLHDHGHGHDHTRKRREVEEHEEDHHEEEKCEFIERIEDKYAGSEGLHMTFDNFLTILPQLLLDKIQSKPCLVGEDDHADDNDEGESDTQNAAKVWLIALASVFIISILSIIGLLTVPLMKYSQFYQRFMAGLIALAVGTLVGDAILHLLPHATSKEEGEHHGAHNHSPNVIYKHLTAVGGIYMFFLFETCMHLYRNYKEEKKNAKNEKVNSNGVKRPSQEEGAEFQDSSLGVLLPTKTANGNNLEILGGSDLENGGQHIIGNDLSTNSSHDSGHQHHCNHDHMIKNGTNSSVLDMAWMVIAGDGLHNFSDGLAIGAAFSSTIAAGLGTSFAIFFHELPHELGDFAILIQAGMSIKQALLYNVMCAMLAFAGVILGIVIGEYASDFKMWVLALTAGGFLYVALVSMLPDLIKTACDKSDKWKFLIVHVGLLSGIFCMLLIALYEDSFENFF